MPIGIYKHKPHTKETIEKMKASKQNMSKLTRERMSKAKKGKRQSKEHIEKRVKKIIGHSMSKEGREKLRQANLGKKLSEETKRKVSMSLTGDKIFNGFRTSINFRIRTSDKYKEWRLMVFGRDDYTCQKCKKRGVYLHAHHIKSFADYPELRFELSNGKTLCKDCHLKSDLHKNIKKGRVLKI